MQVIIVKDQEFDRISITRADGSVADTRFPKKGPVPHDAIHYFVEEELGLDLGFWGLIANGMHPEDVQELAKAGGHTSAKRFGTPDQGIVQLIQAERIVECFEAQLWGSRAAPADFREFARVACESSHTPALELSDEAIARISDRVANLHKEWAAAPTEHSFIFHWGGEGEPQSN